MNQNENNASFAKLNMFHLFGADYMEKLTCDNRENNDAQLSFKTITVRIPITATLIKHSMTYFVQFAVYLQYQTWVYII